MMAERSPTRKKAISVNELSCNLEVDCSMNYSSQGIENFVLSPLAVVLTVDRDNELKMYSVNSDQCELIMKTQLGLERSDDIVSSIHFFIKAKIIIISTE